MEVGLPQSCMSIDWFLCSSKYSAFYGRIARSISIIKGLRGKQRLCASCIIASPVDCKVFLVYSRRGEVCVKQKIITEKEELIEIPIITGDIKCLGVTSVTRYRLKRIIISISFKLKACNIVAQTKMFSTKCFSLELIWIENKCYLSKWCDVGWYLIIISNIWPVGKLILGTELPHCCG